MFYSEKSLKNRNSRKLKYIFFVLFGFYGVFGIKDDAFRHLIRQPAISMAGTSRQGTSVPLGTQHSILFCLWCIAVPSTGCAGSVHSPHRDTPQYIFRESAPIREGQYPWGIQEGRTLNLLLVIQLFSYFFIYKNLPYYNIIIYIIIYNRIIQITSLQPTFCCFQKGA